MPGIKITLKSDLCSGSGQGFSGIIDTDVCYDKYGLPYIPARRLKGVLLYAARYIETDCLTIDKIFGRSGESKSGSLRLNNARIDGYNNLCENLKNNKSDRQKVLALFTDTKAQTAIENDAAAENSLRFTRIVNQYSKIDGSEIVFFADCEIDGESTEQFKKICKAVRNIGLERTRGLGAVRLEFEEKTENGNEKKEEYEKELSGLVSEREYCITYELILNSPLMIPGILNRETTEYISGTAILGALAAEYLKNHKPDEKFEDLFLKENVIFGNAYLEYSIPAPLFLQKVKETGEIRTVFSKSETKGTPKPLKDAFVRPVTFEKLDIGTEITYHHSRGENPTLYTQKHLSEGQIFKGEIIGKGEHIKIIWELLLNGIKIGRSKSAEYSDCSVGNISEKNNIGTIELKHDEDYVIALESDFAVLDEYGNYTADISAVFKAAGFKGDIQKCKSFITTRINAGYNTVWNLKKPHFTAVKAGSYITFKYKGDNKTAAKTKYTGEKNNEGFGKIRLYKLSELETFEYLQEVQPE